MQRNNKKMLIKKHRKSSLKRNLTLVPGLTMLSLGASISLTTYVVQADKATSTVPISQNSSSFSSTSSTTSQSSNQE